MTKLMKGNNIGFWAEGGRVEKLRELWAQGASAGYIAKKLSDSDNAAICTRNMVISKIKRLKLPEPGQKDAVLRFGAGGNNQYTGKPRSERSKALQVRQAERKPAQFAPRPVPPQQRCGGLAEGSTIKRIVTPCAVPPEFEGTAADVARICVGCWRRSQSSVGYCCWPVGEIGAPDFGFCAGPVRGGGPYCPAHAARSRNPFQGEPKPYYVGLGKR